MIASTRKLWTPVTIVVALSLHCGGSEPENDGFGVGPETTSMTTSASDTDPSDDTGGQGSEETGTSADPDTGGPTTGGETGDPPEDGPHALGTIVLGETHAAGTGDALAVLSASFIPDAEATAQSCAMEVGGCQVALPADCMPTVCATDQVCAYDDNCMPTCQPLCNASCAADEVCYFPVPGVAACRDAETFDAGRLDLLGTLEPITLFPPYVLPAGVEGPLAQPDRELTAMGSGATQAGFGMFEATTTSMDSVFSTIDELLPAEAFGVADLPISWTPGVDAMTITVTVTGTLGGTGTVTCEADDTMGTFAIPRAAIDAAVPEDTPNTLSFSLQRAHTETTMGIATVGSLQEQTVQPTGWIDFSYVSIETGSVTNL